MRIYLGTTLLGEGPDAGQWWSSALLCPVCGEVWGRIFRQGEWRADHLPCPKHGDQYRPGGSFATSIQYGGSVALMPAERDHFTSTMRANPKLAEHEFTIHLAWARQFKGV